MTEEQTGLLLHMCTLPCAAAVEDGDEGRRAGGGGGQMASSIHLNRSLNPK